MWKKPPVVAAGVVVTMLLGVGLCSGVPCVTTGLQYGVWADRCPVSALRLSASVDAQNLVRSEWRTVRLDADAHWIEQSQDYGRLDYDYPLSRSLDLTFTLLDGADQAIPGLETRKLRWRNHGGEVQVKIPDVPDGDYRLRTAVDAGFESVDVDVALPFYRPALVHVMSDRPLYKPGQEVLLRSAVLRERDSRPIGERPGVWKILDPSGTEMMVEKLPTDAHGVSATTFPLDSEAEVGWWRAQYMTGANTDEIRFEVKPFELPRFTVELESDKTWYARNDGIELEGTVRYTSGAPVQNAQVELSIGLASGRWPLPLAWEKPRKAKTGSDGHFTVDLGKVPSDLVDLAKISVSARVTDDAKETQSGGAVLTLSQESLLATAVTELRAGLVEKFNNRAYLRVTTPDGRPLREADLVLSNPYDTTQPTMEASTDIDGVAAIQVDPGAPVTIVIPPAPVRPRPLTPAAVSVGTAKEMPGNRSFSLAERRSLDRIHPAIARCGTYAVGGKSINVGVQVRPDGSVQSATSGSDTLSTCVSNATRGWRVGRGSRRTYQITWNVPDSLQPSLSMQTFMAFGPITSETRGALDEAATRARRCFTRGRGIDANVLDVHWRATEGSRALGIDLETIGTAGLSPSVMSCVRQTLQRVTLDEPASQSAVGLTRATLNVPKPPGMRTPRATTQTGFQFAVAASRGGQELGDGKLTLGVGTIPNLRLRATPTLASPGDTVELEVLRGPDYRGTLPEKIWLTRGGRQVTKTDLDPKTRRATFTLPTQIDKGRADGFMEVEIQGAKAVIYVRPAQPLSVNLSTDNDIYKPGDTAKLTVQTKAGETGTPATVSLAGVDQTLSQLSPLLQPDDWGRITVRTTGDKAFDSFGPRALQLGQIRGENAAKATVLLVNNIPTVNVSDAGVWASQTVEPNELEVLTSSFYSGLEQLIAKVRAWERAAPKGELITPEKTSTWWSEVLAGGAVVDAYGLPLTLRSLPGDLREQTAPHQLVADSTRLSEDIDNWSVWIEENAP